ncbi:hybrid sensor histidine kinase/response regulator transcription factor [Mucilaginibacter aquatilis]|uniref:histidine kinase n=1 Tax=Mucilaginibacter aquatilis TaxID=1517760 RepID=A0A6I4IDV5_9SPHI|nr:two-component regulator propeller domain-containing protein [Mucilaginibacter aquatilis]MVN91998.1 response regulator [Mucilaginibacter aquatilis]
MSQRFKSYAVSMLLFTLCLAVFSLCAQPKYNLKHYTTTDGLSHDRVTCILKDTEGFMWFGTWDGINRFDGYNFITYKGRAGDSSNLENNKIRIIVEDKAHYLWVKTFDNKIYRFDKKKEGFLAIQGKNALPNVKDVLVDRIIPTNDGDVWLLSQKQGALCVSGQSGERVTIKAFNQFAKGSAQLAGNEINFLYQDSNLNLWFGTSKGITALCKDGKKLVNLTFDQNCKVLGSGFDFTCFKQQASKIYFGTRQGVVFCYDLSSKNLHQINAADGACINALELEGNKLYLTTTGKGLIQYDLTSGKKQAFVTRYATLRKIYLDKYGLLWLEPSGGIIKFNPTNKTYKHFIQKKDAETQVIHTTYQVFEDAYGILWSCMAGGGFGYYDRSADEFKYFHDKPGTAEQQFSNVVTALYTDPTGIVWFSGYDRGINKIILHPAIFNHQLVDKNADAKTVNEVRSLCEDHNGVLWVGTKAGEILTYKNGVKQTNPFINLNPRDLNRVYCIVEGRNRTIWIGTKGSGLIEAVPLASDSSKYKVIRHVNDPLNKNSISSNLVYTVLEDKRGRIWIGTFAGGLNLLVRNGNNTVFKNQNNSFKNYAQARANGVRHLQEDSRGNIWVASTNGLVIFNPSQGIETFKFHRYTKVRGDETSLGANDVQYILRDASGTMWLGTFGGGLQKALTDFDLNKKIKFQVYTTANGLPNDIVLSIAADNRQHLWIATENGLSEFNPLNQTFKNYNNDDGLPQTQFSESAFIKGKGGQLYLGCLNGFVDFNPQQIGNNRQNATIAFTGFKVANKSIVPGSADSILTNAIDQSQKIVLKHNQNLFSIDYVALNYKIANKVWYAYKLEGFDKQWNYVKDARQATYTNVPPGKYRFVVRTVSNYLFKNKPYKSIVITILPPWWQTWWAYLIYLLLLCIALEVARRVIFTMIRLRHRIAVEKKISAMKVGFFTNISHELRTPLTLIINPLKQIAKDETLSAKGREHINLVNKNADRMVRFINQLLDFRKLQEGKAALKLSQTDIVQLVKNTTSYFSEVAVEKDIDFNIHIDTPFYLLPVDEEKVDIVIYNVLANAFKYTPSGRSISVAINTQANDGFTSIKVIDEGIGVPDDKLNEIFELYYEGSNSGADVKGTGIGLAFSRELINAHQGQITAENNPNGGMTFTIKLKTNLQNVSIGEYKSYDTNQPTNVEPAQNLPPAVYKNAGDLNKWLVLIVEDNTELRKFLSDQLSEYYRVETAADGVEGLERARILNPDLIISDVMMPKMDGIAMLDALKNELSTSHIPVVLLTARSSVEHQIEGMRYGADFYVTKPFNTEYVVVLVESLIRQRKQMFANLLNSKKLVQLSPGEILITSKDEELLKLVVETVEQGMSDCDFNIDDVAGAVGLGRTTFYKKLKSLTGLAPVEFVKEMRLKRAKQLIDSGEFNMSEISYQIGFNSSGYFSTCFKEKYGQTPSQYLKSLKEAHS